MQFESLFERNEEGEISAGGGAIAKSQATKLAEKHENKMEEIEGHPFNLDS